ncbi:MAG: pyridoxal phosphate-dependent aminotransferase [Thermodesulfobacteriota bacterium]|nr:pyridoxal phosphate-dependent aminotransferase [Thermodesulfobacteriota bacterium]
MSRRFSVAAQNLVGQPMFRMLSKIQDLEKQGKQILHFELGDPDFPTPTNISEAAIKSIREGNTHYVNSMGIRELREAAQLTTKLSRGFEPGIDQVLVTPGANYIIFLAISTLVNPGEEIIIPDPGFPTYTSAANFVGAKTVFVPVHEENNFRLSPDDVESKITDKTRLLIVNSPANPTGSVMTKEELLEVGKIAEKKNLYLLTDEVYSRLIFDSEKTFFSPSTLDQCKKRTIIINGLSKAFSMTGWRIGIAIGPSDVIAKMGLVVETLSSCTPPFCQIAGLEAINGDQSELIKMKKEYFDRKNMLVKGLNDINGISCVDPGGAMYVFPNIKKTNMTSDEFSEYVLKKTGIGVLPGNNFGANGEGYIRMCYSTSQDDIKEALDRLKALFG